MKVLVILDMLHDREQNDIWRLVQTSLPYDKVKDIIILNDDRIEKIKSLFSFQD